MPVYPGALQLWSSYLSRMCLTAVWRVIRTAQFQSDVVKLDRLLAHQICSSETMKSLLLSIGCMCCCMDRAYKCAWGVHSYRKFPVINEEIAPATWHTGWR